MTQMLKLGKKDFKVAITITEHVKENKSKFYNRKVYYIKLIIHWILPFLPIKKKQVWDM